MVLLSSSIKPNFVPSLIQPDLVSLALLATTSSAMSSSNPTAPYDSSDELSEQEIEEFDRAVALSLAGDTLEEQQLVEVLARSLDLGPPRRDCSGCLKPIGDGSSLNHLGAVWHPQCFKCQACSQPIAQEQFTLEMRLPYHKACYTPKCDVCMYPLPTNQPDQIIYNGKQKYCISHERDGTPMCSGCGEMKPRNTKYTKRGGVISCPNCA